MSTRELITQQLQNHNFNTQTPMFFGVIDKPAMAYPFGLTTDVFVAVNARRMSPSYVAEQLIDEIRIDLDSIKTKHQYIKQYGLWIYQLPTTNRPYILYCKVVSEK